MDSKKVLPIATILGITATAFALATGVFDRGTSSGVLMEKIHANEKIIEKYEDRTNLLNQKFEDLNKQVQKLDNNLFILDSRTDRLETAHEKLENRMMNSGRYNKP